MPDQNIKITIEGSDNLSPSAKSATQAIDGLKRGCIELKGVAVEMVKGFIGFEAIAEVIREIPQMMREAAKALQSEDAFNNMATSFDKSAYSMMESMKGVSRGMIEESDLAQKALQGFALGLNDEQIVGLLDASRTAAKIWGQDMKSTFDTLVVAVGGGVRAMGPLVRQGAVTKEQFQELNKAMAAGVEDVDLYSLVIANLTIAKARLSNEDLNAAEKMQQFDAEVKSVKENIGKGLIVVLEKVFGVLQGVASAALLAYAGLLKLNEGYAILASMNPLNNSEWRQGWAAYAKQLHQDAKDALSAAGELSQRANANILGGEQRPDDSEKRKQAAADAQKTVDSIMQRVRAASIAKSKGGDKDYDSQDLASLKEYYAAKLSIIKTEEGALSDAIDKAHKEGLLNDEEWYEARDQGIKAAAEAERDEIQKELALAYDAYSKAWDKAAGDDGKRHALTEKYKADREQLSARLIATDANEAKQLNSIDLERSQAKKAIDEDIAKTNFEITRMSIEQRLAAELDGIKQEQDQNKTAFDMKLISAKDFQAKALELLDKETDAKKKALKDQLDLFVQEKMAEVAADGKSDLEKQKTQDAIIVAIKKYNGDVESLTRDSVNKRLQIEKDASAEQANLFKETANTIENALIKAFERPKEALKDLTRFFLTQFEKMAAHALANPIIIPITQALVGSPGQSAAAAYSAGYQGPAMENGQFSAGTPGLMNSLAPYAPLIMPATQALNGNWGGAVGGLAGFALSGTLGNAFGAVAGTAVMDTLGSTALAGIMSAMPMIGTLLGMALGQLIPKLFKGPGGERIPDFNLFYDEGGSTPGHGWSEYNDPTNHFGLGWQGGADLSSTAAPIVQGLIDVRERVLGTLKDLGLSVDGFYKSWHFDPGSLEGLKPEEIAQRIKDAYADYINFASGIDFGKLKDNGEKLSDTIDRIVTAMAKIVSVKDIDAKDIYSKINLTPNTYKDAIDTTITAIGKDVAKLNSGDLDPQKWGDTVTEIGKYTDDLKAQIVQYLTYIKQLGQKVDNTINGMIEKYQTASMSTWEKTVAQWNKSTGLLSQLKNESDPPKIEKITTELLGSVDQLLSGLAELSKGFDQLHGTIQTQLEKYALDGMTLTEKIGYYYQKAHNDWFGDGTQPGLKDETDYSKKLKLTADLSSSLDGLYNSLMSLKQAVDTVGASAKKTYESMHMEMLPNDQERVAYLNNQMSGKGGLYEQYETAKKAGDTEKQTSLGQQIIDMVNQAWSMPGINKALTWATVGPMLQEIQGDMSGASKTIGDEIKDTLIPALTTLSATTAQNSTDLKTAITTLVGYLPDLKTAIQDKLAAAVSALADAISGPNGLTAKLGSINWGAGLGTPHAYGLDYVPYDGYRATLHSGEAVITAQGNTALSQMAAAMAAGGGAQPIHIHISGEIAPFIDIAADAGAGRAITIIRQDPSVLVPA